MLDRTDTADQRFTGGLTPIARAARNDCCPNGGSPPGARSVDVGIRSLLGPVRVRPLWRQDRGRFQHPRSCLTRDDIPAVPHAQAALPVESSPDEVCDLLAAQPLIADHEDDVATLAFRVQ